MEQRYQQHGVFSWNELMTTDRAGAVEFYSKLFRWSAEDMNMADMTYTVVTSDGVEIGGIMDTPPETKGRRRCGAPTSRWMTSTRPRQKRKPLAAGVLIPPRDTPGVGWFSLIQDPQGAAISVITYESQTG